MLRDRSALQLFFPFRPERLDVKRGRRRSVCGVDREPYGPHTPVHLGSARAAVERNGPPDSLKCYTRAGGNIKPEFADYGRLPLCERTVQIHGLGQAETHIACRNDGHPCAIPDGYLRGGEHRQIWCLHRA